jgi:aminoglycoside phosphotransferase (APT) family kinase protein
VPSPVLSEADASKLGGSFIVVAEVRDAERAGEFFAELNDLSQYDANFATDLAKAMARLHRLTEHPSGDALGGHTAAVEPIDMVRNFQQLWTSLTQRPPMSAATELGFAWLSANPLPAGRPRRLVHGDIGFHNLMRRGGKLAAILDWELTHLGDPAEDLSYPRIPMIEALTSWERFVSAYLAAGGPPEACEPRALAWYGVWAYTRNSVYTGLLYDWAMTGKRTDLEAFSVGWDFFDRLQGYVSRQLVRAIETWA